MAVDHVRLGPLGATYVQIGLCVEIVGNGGPKGFGVLARVEGGIDAGVVAVTYGAGISFVVVVFTTGSTDYARRRSASTRRFG